MEKMAEKEIAEAFELLKIERVKSFRANAKIISQWNFKTSYKGAEINPEDANVYIKTSIHFN